MINKICKDCAGYTQPNGCIGDVEYITIHGIVREPKQEFCYHFRTIEENDEYEQGLSDYVNSCEDYGFPVEDCPF